MSTFWYTKELKTSFLEALDDITLSLAKEWFWVLTKIDIQSKLREKLSKNIDEYFILWACNPWLASEALDCEYEIWLLLPCNVIVYKKEEKIFVSAILPSIAMSMVGNSEIKKVAIIAEEKLKRAINNI